MSYELRVMSDKELRQRETALKAEGLEKEELVEEMQASYTLQVASHKLQVASCEELVEEMQAARLFFSLEQL